MMLVLVGYLKSRPGATTTSLGLAAVLPAQARPVVVECDPSGGDLAARFGVPVSPGLVELSTAVRSASSEHLDGRSWWLSRFASRVSIADRRVEVVMAPPGGARPLAALSVLAHGWSILAAPGRTVIADCGRLDIGLPTRPLLETADAVLVLARGRLDELAHLREHMPILATTARGRLSVVLVAGGHLGVEEVAAALAADGHPTPVCGPLPYDEVAAAVLEGQAVADRRWRSLPLFAALTAVATGLPVRLTPPFPRTASPAVA